MLSATPASATLRSNEAISAGLGRKRLFVSPAEQGGLRPPSDLLEGQVRLGAPASCPGRAKLFTDHCQ
jgi:hypothetical protein